MYLAAILPMILSLSSGLKTLTRVVPRRSPSLFFGRYFDYGPDHNGPLIRENLLKKQINVEEIRNVLDRGIIEDDVPIHYG
jgi:hypothetical protein